MKKKTVSIRLDDEIIEKLKQFAEKDNRTLSNFVKRVLKLYIENKKK